MKKSSIEQRLRDAGHELPIAQKSSYSYDTVVCAAGLAYVSGQIPKVGTEVAWQGAVGSEVTVEGGVAAAEICALNVLAQIEGSLGFEEVERLVKLTVYVASAEEFVDQPAVAEGASRLMRSALGECGRHSRTAIGVPRLPKDATVEVEAVFALTDQL